MQDVRERLDLLEHPAAVLDLDGAVVMVNRAWERFCSENAPDDVTAGTADRDVGPDADGASCVSGTTYRDFLDDGDDVLARRSAEGVFDVIEGRSDAFDLVYPCHAPDEERWFRLVVAPLDASASPRRVLTMHVRLDVRHGAREFGVDGPPVRPERSVCAWCNDAERRGDRWVPLRSPLGPDDAVTHGICPSCAEAQLAELAATT